MLRMPTPIRDDNTSNDSTAREPSGSTSQSSRTHIRHRRHRRRPRPRFKQKERNFPAAVCSMIVIVVLCTSMAEPSWFQVHGGGCRNNVKQVHNLGVFHFFYVGHFSVEPKGNPQTDNAKYVYHYSSKESDMLIDCVSPKVVQIMHSIIALCFIGATLSIMAFLLDLAGPATRTLKFLRRNAVFNVLAVVCCVTINGFSFLVTQLVEQVQLQTKVYRGSKVDVKFDVSFYLVAASGAISVIGAACNLLRRYPPHEPHEHRERLLDDYDGMDFPIGAPGGQPEMTAPMSTMPPPPAYSP